jgi:hypothetical protein
MAPNEPKAGHRARLRKRFVANPTALSEAELMELLLTYAVPRQDVAPQAESLMVKFGSLDSVLAASMEELVSVPGIGEHTAVLIKLADQLTKATSSWTRQVSAPTQQPTLFEVEPPLGPLFDDRPEPSEPEMSTYANDEVANALELIPQAAQFETFEAFKNHLCDNLPYNSESTRKRRAGYILKRFFPKERLDVPLTYYAARCTSQEDLKPAVFYHVLKAEPLAAKVAEELIWPALPVGRIGREDMREFILRHLPDISKASQTKILQALFKTYHLLSVAAEEGTSLRFQIHTGTLSGFLYVLTAQFAQSGIYSFETLEQGPMRHWLLWDREWMRGQLYNLRDLGIISKVSEIDTVRQFTLQFDQWTALRHFFEHPQRDKIAMREESTTWPLERMGESG